VSVSCSGGSYGAPRDRDPDRVARNVSEGWITPERAEAVYGVALTAEGMVDAVLTERIRAQ
jgi:N-methylhydantoinase B